MTSTLASQRPPQLSSPALTRRSFPRRNRIHYDNRSKELLVEKQDSPICPSSHLTSHFFLAGGHPEMEQEIFFLKVNF